MAFSSEAEFLALEQRHPRLIEDLLWQKKVLDRAMELVRRTNNKAWIEDTDHLERVHLSLARQESVQCLALTGR